MGITVSGLASGIDVDKIVEQLAEVEKKPIESLRAKEEDYNVMLSAYGNMKKELANLNSSLKDLQFPSDFSSFKAVPEKEELFTASASEFATSGAYTIDVTQVAQEQKLTSGAFTETEETGEGTLSIQVGSGESFDVAVSSTATLSDLSNAINESQAEVKAGVIFDGTSYFLTLTSDKTGAANTINLSVTDADGNNTDNAGLSRLVAVEGGQAFVESKEAKDAIFAIDGVANIHRESNTIDDVIKGVTLTLNSDGESGKLTVSRDTETVLAKVETFIEKFNNVLTFFFNSQKYDRNADAQGTLFGDSTATRINSNLSRLVGNMVQDMDSFSYLSDLGIEMKRVLDKDSEEAGKRFLEIDTAKFEAALNKDPEEAVSFFTRNEKGKEGFSVRMINLLSSFTDPETGLLSTSTSGLQTKIDDIDKQVEKIESRIETSEARIRSQFLSLETLIGRYKATGEQLTSQLSGLANLNKQIANG